MPVYNFISEICEEIVLDSDTEYLSIAPQDIGDKILMDSGESGYFDASTVLDAFIDAENVTVTLISMFITGTDKITITFYEEDGVTVVENGVRTLKFFFLHTVGLFTAKWWQTGCIIVTMIKL